MHNLILVQNKSVGTTLDSAISGVVKSLFKNLKIPEEVTKKYISNADKFKDKKGKWNIGDVFSNNKEFTKLKSLVLVEHKSKVLGKNSSNINIKPSENDNITKDLPLIVTPNYFDYTTNINVTYLSKSRETIIEFINMLILKSRTDTRTPVMCNTTYNYYPPQEFHNIVNQYRLIINSINIDKKSYIDFLLKHSSDNVIVQTNKSNDVCNISYLDKQVSIYVNDKGEKFELEYEYNEEYDMYSLSIPYEFTINLPVSLSIKYDYLYYNKILPNGYIRKYDKVKHYTRLRYFNNIFRNTNPIIDKSIDTVMIPFIDNSFIQPPSKWSRVLMSTTALLDNVDNTKLFNLNDLEDVVLSKSFKDILIDNSLNNIDNSIIGSTPINITLLENNKITTIKVNIDKDLNVTTDIPLDISKLYKVVFSLVTDKTILNKYATNLLTKVGITNEVNDLISYSVGNRIELSKDKENIIIDNVPQKGLLISPNNNDSIVISGKIYTGMIIDSNQITGTNENKQIVINNEIFKSFTVDNGIITGNNFSIMGINNVPTKGIKIDGTDTGTVVITNLDNTKNVYTSIIINNTDIVTSSVKPIFIDIPILNKTNKHLSNKMFISIKD